MRRLSVDLTASIRRQGCYMNTSSAASFASLAASAAYIVHVFGFVARNTIGWLPKGGMRRQKGWGEGGIWSVNDRPSKKNSTKETWREDDQNKYGDNIGRFLLSTAVVWTCGAVSSIHHSCYKHSLVFL